MSNRGFTEAVPLSLSSMAHMTMPLEDGVLDGLKQVLQHTLLSCVNYARAIHAPHQWTFRDLTTSKFAWEPHQVDPPTDISPNLSKLGFKHQYHRTAFIYLKPALRPEMTLENELSLLQEDFWSKQPGILGRVSLLYATTALMTEGELNGTEPRDEDTPKCVLCKAVVEYRSLPPTGKKAAVQAEELSMLSFGGSVDDDVKYGALASLYDHNAKYVLEINSVRGKKYKFDLMDSTLSDGTVPRLPARGGGGDNGQGNNAAQSDPFVKSLCVTVTDHETAAPASSAENYAITRINLTLEGNLRTSIEEVPPPHFFSTQLQETFLSLNHSPPAMATAMPSGHTLLLDASEAGKVYINGHYVTTWGKDPRIGSHFPSLFGMDLHSIPYWHGRIFDYDLLKRNYAQLWQEVLIDARLMAMNVGGILLSRLITGKDPFIEEDEDDHVDGDDDNSDLDLDDDDEAAQNGKGPADASKPGPPRININLDCLESQVMSSTEYDPVGISAKALATRFIYEYGEEGFPCLSHEMDWVKDRLPGRVPVVVPQRAINIFRRGGFFDTKRTSDEVWFAESRPAKEGSQEEALVQRAVSLLQEAGCSDVTPNVIVFFSGAGISQPVQKKGLVRFNRSLRQYHVNQYFLEMDLVDVEGGMSMDEDGNGDMTTSKTDIEALAFLLGLHIAQEHPDGNMLIRYLLKHRKGQS